MRVDKQARGKTRKKYARGVRRLAGLIRWGFIVIGLIMGLVMILAGSVASELAVTGVTNEIMSQLPADDSTIGIIGGADGPTSIMVSSATDTSGAGMVGGIVGGVVIFLWMALIGWMGSVALYGFAELIYCQEEIVAQNTKQIKLLEKIAGEGSYEDE